MNLKVFKFENQEVRTELRNGDPYFCLKDVCDVLELKNHKQVLSRLNMGYIVYTPIIDRMGREQTALFINESNLYKLIFQSRKKEAERFQDWISENVLPEIRKTGGYNLVKKLPKTFADALKLAYEQQLEIQEQQAQIELQKPAVEFYEAVADCKEAIDMGSVAKVIKEEHGLSIGRNNLFRFLRDHKVLMSDNTPMQYGVDRGYFRVIEQKYKTGTETRISLNVC